MIGAMSKMLHMNPAAPVRFFQTPEYECAYLPRRAAAAVFVDPATDLSGRLHSQLALIGFRRSGRFLYRPCWRRCDACLPLRLPTRDFTPSRSQRRVWNKNQDLIARIKGDSFSNEHFELYARYQQLRHAGGGMDKLSPRQYLNFLRCDWMGADTRFVEFRLHGALLAVAVVDFLRHGLAAVYTFYEPRHEKRGLGTFCILWQAQAARRLGLQWLYLGHWIGESAKMRYKNRFKPYEVLAGGMWRRYE